MATSSLVSVTIDSVGGLGDGIGRFDGRPVFVPKSAAGDVLSIRITQQTKEFMRGEIAQVVTQGPERITPPCQHFANCGGCSLQQLSDSAYKAFKQRVLSESLAHGGFPGTSADISFLASATRRRVDFKVQHSGKTLSLAFNGLRSHSLVPIDKCLILEPQLQSLVALLPSALSRLPGAQNIKAVSLTLADSGVDMLLELAGAPPMIELASLAKNLSIARIATLDNKTISIAFEAAPVTMRLGEYDVLLPPDAFLQAAKEGQKILTDFVLAHTAKAKNIVDLFCGIGTYSFPASRYARVHAVEMQGEAVESLNAAIDSNKIRGYLSTEARDLFQRPLTAPELARYDSAIVNPPRAGAKAQIEAIAASAIKNVVMISCNPASFSRDAKILKAAGFILTHAHGLDQFVWSPHLEIAAAFTRG